MAFVISLLTYILRKVDRILSEDVQLNRLRSQAPAPPEMFEPLIAFHGLLHFSYDVSTRLEQKLASIDAALTTITRTFCH